MTSESRRIFFFGEGRADAGSEVKHLVGGKGASLGDMSRAGLAVPPGFTMSTECCRAYYDAGRRWPDGLEADVRAALARLEKLVGRPFGKGDDPLLVAVRSGAAQSMPGMMDTLLNVGLAPDCVRAMATRTQNPRGAWQAYFHFQRMFAKTVADLPEATLDGLLHDALLAAKKSREDDLDGAEFERLCDAVAQAYRTHAGEPFPVEPWDLLRRSIDAVFGSWHNDRAVTYREHHQIDGLLGTAVNIQAMCPSEVSGVMFTGNPVDPRSDQLLIESSYGLGEAIVLGKVTPDRFVLDKKTLTIAERHIARKDKRVATLTDAALGAADAASLSDFQVRELARLGMRVDAHFGYPCDLEWALSRGQFYLLQARPIRYKGAALVDPEEKERIRQEEIAALRSLASPAGTVWSRFNLSEILADPTPMTWSIVRRFMSGRGGFGLMYRDLGFTPDASMDDACAYDLVAGRVYCNLDREPKMQFGPMPFVHRFRTLKADPSRAVYPQAEFDPRQAGLGFWVKLPWLSVQQWWGESKRQGALRRFAAQFEEKIAPPFVAACASAAQEDWTKLSSGQLVETLDEWTRKTLDDFARESLKPTALAAILMAKIEGAFARRLQPPGTKPKPDAPPAAARAKALLRDLTMGVRPPDDADFAKGIEELAAGTLSREKFLAAFGHRANHEMELAHARWAEDAAAVDALAKRPTGAGPHATPSFAETWKRVAQELRLAPFQIPMVERELRSLHRLLGLREAGKHHMLRGYALMRRALALLDQRYGLDGGVFYLTREELPELVRIAPGSVAGVEPLVTRIRERRRRREIALSLTAPQVLFSDDLDALGRAIVADGANAYQGTPLSAGTAEATAWVLDDVVGAVPPGEPYILVCPTTDPAWVPLFAQAKGLVMETGGVLSHGAIVAREFGLPAVAGIPDVHRRLRTGQRLSLDGAAGVVKILD